MHLEMLELIELQPRSNTDLSCMVEVRSDDGVCYLSELVGTTLPDNLTSMITRERTNLNQVVSGF